MGAIFTARIGARLHSFGRLGATISSPDPAACRLLRDGMKTPSTADSREPSGLPVDSATDPALERRSATHRNVKGQSAPRLPHERDESSDSGTAEPSPLMRQAAKDAASGRPSTDRGEVTDELYERTLRDDRTHAPDGSR